MRKTSQDGGDTSSITSGVENEFKKSGAIIKSKKNSIKRKVQNLSNEFDETVIEPLLQNDNERTETATQSAKYLLMTTKTDIISAKGNENNKIVTDINKTLPANSRIISETTSFTVPGIKENIVPKCLGNPIATVQNHMNTNVFSGQNITKTLITPNTQILVEIDGTKQMSYNPSPLIFTTAKIHTDGKTQHMEPVQVTPVPILSIVEVSVLKAEDVASKSSQAVVSTYSNASAGKLKSVDKDQKPKINTSENNITPGVLRNNVSHKATTSDHNVQTKLNKTSSLTAADEKMSSKSGQAVASTYSNASTSKLKSVDEDQKPKVNTSENNITPGLLSNNVSKKATTSDNNVQTTHSKTSSLTAADVKVFSKSGQAVASTYSNASASNVKSVDKDLKPKVNTSENNITPGVLSNNISNKATASDHNIQNTLNETSSITAADVKVSTNNVKDKLKGSLLTNDNNIIKKESKATISQSNLPVKSIPTTSNKRVDGTKKEEQNKKVDSTLVTMKDKVDDSNEIKLKTDVNKNIQPIGVVNIDPHYSGKSNNPKNNTETSKHDKPLKNPPSSSSNKHLQRQKNTKIDDTNDSEMTSKNSVQKETDNKFKSSPETKISDHNVSDKLIQSKSNCVSMNIITTQTVPKVTASVTSTGKSELSSASAIKFTSANTANAVNVKSNETSSNQSNEIKTKSSAIVKSSTATAMSKPAAKKVAVTTKEPALDLVTVSSPTALVTTTRTASTTSSITKVKTPITAQPATAQSAPSIKQPIASTISAKSTPYTTSMEKAPICTSSSSLASTSVTKSIANKDISKPLSSNKNPETSTTPSSAAVKSKMLTKKSGQKSSEHNNDGKSSKA